jgi:hypothetical protein
MSPKEHAHCCTLLAQCAELIQAQLPFCGQITPASPQSLPPPPPPPQPEPPQDQQQTAEKHQLRLLRARQARSAMPVMPDLVAMEQRNARVRERQMQLQLQNISDPGARERFVCRNDKLTSSEG